MKRLLFLLIIFLFVYSEFFAQTGKPQYLIRTERADTVLGFITIELYPMVAPLHCANFDSLVNLQFYDTTAFHRVVPDFVIQGGDPNSRHGPRETWGEGDPSQPTVPAEFTNADHKRGTIGAARDEDINSANSQFYINVADNSGLNGQYTLYGRVLEGMDVVDFIVNVPRDANDNPNEKIEMFVTSTGVVTHDQPGVPALVSPAEGEEGAIGAQRLEWTAIDDVVIYNVQVSTEPDFSTLFYEGNSGVESIGVIDLEPGQVKYYWRVNTNNGGYVSDFSEVRSFVTSINTPVLLLPENNAVDVALEPECQWEAVTGATSYKIFVATTPTFVASSVVYEVGGITETNHTLPELEPNKKYYWKVQGFTDTYEGPKSPLFKFTTMDVTSVDVEINIPKKFELKQNYPNPFNPTTSIKYSVPKNSFVKIEIYNSMGELISRLVNEQSAPGNYETQWDASNQTSGIYLIKMVADNFVDVKKSLLIK